MKSKTVEQAAAYLFAALFIYAAVSKMTDFQNFRVQLGQSPLLTAYAKWFAVIVPALEIGISAMLLSRHWRLPGLYAAFTLMVMFTAYIIAILGFSDYVPCSCGGILQKMHWNAHLAFNIVFTLIGVAGVLSYQSSEQIKPFVATNKRGSRKPLEKSRQ